MRLLRVLLITLFLLGAIVTLVPEDPVAGPSASPSKALVASELGTP